jgi:NosR/NirI family nitrous oxide reductase transcriptional regulator
LYALARGIFLACGGGREGGVTARCAIGGDGRGTTPLLLLLLVLIAAAAPQRLLAAGNPAQRWPVLRRFFPGADRFGAFSGKPPAASVYRGDKVIGYFFRTKMVAPIPAYSGKPVDVLVGIDTKGHITGTKVLEQHEPILLVGIPVQRLYDFVKQYIGKVVTDRFVVGGPRKGGADYVRVDAISSATVTSMVVNRTITAAAMKVAVARHLVSPGAGWNEPMARVRMNLFHPADWKELLGNGSIRHLVVTAQEVNKAFHGVQGEVWHRIPKSGIYIDLYYAYLNAPTVGRNLLGKQQYDVLMASLKPGEHAIALMANGPFSFKGYGYVRGGIFDRVHLMQNNNLILFHDLDFQDLYGLAIHGALAFHQRGIFIVRKNYGFDPGSPWTLQLLVRRQIGPIKSLFTTFNGGYRLPAAYYVRPPAPKQEPIWVAQWRAQRVQIAVLGVALALLTVVLFLQDYLVRRSVFLVRFRTVYLIFTLGFIGWYALGQLSIVNVLTFINSLFHGFRWQTFLMAPMLFILWTYVAAALLLWGRGVFCGWLCPFGALQKLTNELARLFRVPQIKIPALIHERLWAIKYLILLALFGVSLQSTSLAERYAEVEPFKTAISLHFVRPWPFVAYAAGLVFLSAFIQKFYCRYLCPLGAALAVPARLRLFDWLRRRKECGKPCQVCANECEIQAIHETGEINANECHYCLDCQVTYWNDRKCPPLVERRKRHERVPKARAAVRRMEEGMGGGTEVSRASVEVEPPVR